MADKESQNGRPKALVTGAAQGIGVAIAVALAKDGFDLALTSRKPETLDDTIEQVNAAGGSAVAVGLDQSSVPDIERAVAEAVSKLGGIDVLVNNAGMQVRKLALEVTSEEWDELMSVNLKGVFFMSREVGRHFVETDRKGRVITIGSIHGLVGFPQRSTYGISKAAVHHMTKMLSYEWADHGIRVNAVAPGMVETASRVEYFNARPKEREALLARVPLKRFTSIDDVAGAVSYLAGPQGAYITGQVIVLDGGITAH